MITITNSIYSRENMIIKLHQICLKNQNNHFIYIYIYDRVGGGGLNMITVSTEER